MILAGKLIVQVDGDNTGLNKTLRDSSKSLKTFAANAIKDNKATTNSFVSDWQKVETQVSSSFKNTSQNVRTNSRNMVAGYVKVWTDANNKVVADFASTGRQIESHMGATNRRLSDDIVKTNKNTTTNYQKQWNAAIGNVVRDMGRVNAAVSNASTKLKGMMTGATTVIYGGSKGFSVLANNLHMITNEAAIAGSILSATLTAGAVGVAKYVNEFVDLRQQSQISFTGMMGDAQKAADFIDKLQQFAVPTPFEFPDLLKQARAFMSVGVEVKKILPMMKGIGDFMTRQGTAGSPVKVKQVTDIFADMLAGDRLQAREISRLQRVINFNALKPLADWAGVTTSQFRKLMKEGIVPSQTAVEALVAFMEKQAPNAMLKGADLIQTQISGISDRLQALLGWNGNSKVPNGLLAPLYDETVKALKFLGDQLGIFQQTAKNWSDQTKKNFINGFAALASVGPILLSISGALKLLGAFASPIGILSAGIALLSYYLLSNKEAARAVGDAVKTAIPYFKTLAETAMGGATSSGKTLTELLVRLIGALTTTAIVVTNVIKWFGTLSQSTQTFIIYGLSALALITKLTGGFGGLWGILATKVLPIITSTFNMMQVGVGTMGALDGALIAGIGTFGLLAAAVGAAAAAFYLWKVNIDMATEAMELNAKTAIQDASLPEFQKKAQNVSQLNDEIAALREFQRLRAQGIMQAVVPGSALDRGLARGSATAGGSAALKDIEKTIKEIAAGRNRLQEEVKKTQKVYFDGIKAGNGGKVGTKPGDPNDIFGANWLGQDWTLGTPAYEPLPAGNDDDKKAKKAEAALNKINNAYKAWIRSHQLGLMTMEKETEVQKALYEIADGALVGINSKQKANVLALAAQIDKFNEQKAAAKEVSDQMKEFGRLTYEVTKESVIGEHATHEASLAYDFQHKKLGLVTDALKKQALAAAASADAAEQARAASKKWDASFKELNSGLFNIKENLEGELNIALTGTKTKFTEVHEALQKLLDKSGINIREFPGLRNLYKQIEGIARQLDTVQVSDAWNKMARGYAQQNASLDQTINDTYDRGTEATHQFYKDNKDLIDQMYATGNYFTVVEKVMRMAAEAKEGALKAFYVEGLLKFRTATAEIYQNARKIKTTDPFQNWIIGFETFNEKIDKWELPEAFAENMDFLWDTYKSERAQQAYEQTLETFKDISKQTAVMQARNPFEAWLTNFYEFDNATKSWKLPEDFNKDYLKQLFDYNEAMTLTQQLAEGITDVFGDMFDTIKDKGFGGLFNSVMQGFQKMIAKMAQDYLKSQLLQLLQRTLTSVFGITMPGAPDNAGVKTSSSAPAVTRGQTRSAGYGSVQNIVNSFPTSQGATMATAPVGITSANLSNSTIGGAGAVMGASRHGGYGGLYAGMALAALPFILPAIGKIFGMGRTHITETRANMVPEGYVPHTYGGVNSGVFNHSIVNNSNSNSNSAPVVIHVNTPNAESFRRATPNILAEMNHAAKINERRFG